FFQAEDGIRDFHVTGVQTCALPIWHPGGTTDLNSYAHIFKFFSQYARPRPRHFFQPGAVLMPFRVLVVDDSNFFQQRLKEIISQNPELKVVGIASNGREAVEKAAELEPDIITMDFEMPVMDGVTAIKLIMA